MNDRANRKAPVGDRIFVSAVFGLNACIFSWIAVLKHGYEGWWSLAAGFLLAVPAQWFPRSGRVRWALAGASIALLAEGSILLAFHR